MAPRLGFAKTHENGLHTYRYIAEEGPVRRSWPGLNGDWPDHAGADWAVNYSYREYLAVYLGLVWRLTDGLMRYVVPRWERRAGMLAFGEPYALVDWEYEIDDGDNGDAGRIAGFVPARSCTAFEPGPWASENAGRAGMFELRWFGGLVELARMMRIEPTAELHLYALSEPEAGARGAEVAEALMGTERPDLAALLVQPERLVHVIIGQEIGYADIIVVQQSPQEIDGFLTHVVDQYEAAIAEYESHVDEIASVDEFHRRLALLVGVPDYP